MPGIKNAFGGAQIRDDRPGGQFNTEERVKELLKVLKEGDVPIIDSAQLYGNSEEFLGKVNAGDEFIIDTKAKGGFEPGTATKEGIIKGAKESLEKLKVKKVDIFYIHAPDSSIPISETLAGINEAYKAGYFSRFGLSNYQAEDVQKVYDHCKENSYVLPTVYQGNYSAVARKQETLLFPTLRKLGIAFYAYSPIAGGFLVKTKQQIIDGVNLGRFDPSTGIGEMYMSMYNKPAYLEALSQWEAIAKEAGCSKADLAYRWVKYNSPLKPEYGDAIIIGASKLEQLKQTLSGISAGPLSEDITKKIDEVWTTIEHEAPLDNYHR